MSCVSSGIFHSRAVWSCPAVSTRSARDASTASTSALGKEGGTDGRRRAQGCQDMQWCCECTWPWSESCRVYSRRLRVSSPVHAGPSSPTITRLRWPLLQLTFVGWHPWGTGCPRPTPLAIPNCPPLCMLFAIPVTPTGLVSVQAGAAIASYAGSAFDTYHSQVCQMSASPPQRLALRPPHVRVLHCSTALAPTPPHLVSIQCVDVSPVRQGPQLHGAVSRAAHQRVCALPAMAARVG